MSSPQTPAPGPGRFPLRWWDASTAVTLGVMALIGWRQLQFEGTGAAGAAWAFAPLAGIALWYCAVGRRVLLRAVRDLPPRPSDAVFLAVLLILIGTATYGVASYATLQTIGYPLVWTIARRYREAVAWSAGLSCAVCIGFIGQGEPFDRVGGIWGALAVAALSLVFALAMGTWITGVYARGERHRELTDALRRSQHEVAALSEAAGASAERERISRDLHDTLTQTLTGLVMLSEQADRALAADDVVAARDRLERVRSAARDSLQEARALVATTQPLGDGGLEAAITRMATRLREDTGLRVTCELDQLPLERERQVMLLRAAQEGLANARKHARAEAVVLTLARADDGAAVLRVDDDGVGPAGAGAVPVGAGARAGATPSGPAPIDGRAAAGGYGLTGLADRIRGVGGEVRFGRGPERGARLEVRLPALAAAAATTDDERGGSR
ncbi:sensor histidine kinase [Leucobacter chromiiresistens]|uniref:Signal transduction histidine kinase n=2 Tax=Leucobacter chromiiresistens TaxID=1079994 RepID=A0A1H0YED9_9MICO|nr:sensor histidine kinase [Leucobacter chromiiresistens]SDQ13331.1 Signal transduction histidine kinase [Leucobacter chromiiresistens]